MQIRESARSIAHISLRPITINAEKEADFLMRLASKCLDNTLTWKSFDSRCRLFAEKYAQQEHIDIIMCPIELITVVIMLFTAFTICPGDCTILYFCHCFDYLQQNCSIISQETFPFIHYLLSSIVNEHNSSVQTKWCNKCTSRQESRHFLFIKNCAKLGAKIATNIQNSYLLSRDHTSIQDKYFQNLFFYCRFDLGYNISICRYQHEYLINGWIKIVYYHVKIASTVSIQYPCCLSYLWTNVIVFLAIFIKKVKYCRLTIFFALY